jgi:lactoylglutathione lyase
MPTDRTKWKLNHTMLRVKDPQRSINFYNLLGLTQINKISQPEANFDLYFLAYDSPSARSSQQHWTDRQGVLELTHNYGTENDPNFKVANGNEEPTKGFGHVAISVDNIQAACQRLEDAGVPFQKKLTDGKMRSIAFIKDPDGYWVEIIPQKPLQETEDVKQTDPQSYSLNHTMIRVKDPNVSLKFYQEVMGMTLMRTLEMKDANFNLYFLGYGEVPTEGTAEGVSPVARHEGILELTWNFGTEKEDGRVYHDGNTEPRGFGHICVAVDELNEACSYLEGKKVNWKKRLTDGRMKTVAFVLDPDGYWIELIARGSQP